MMKRRRLIALLVGINEYEDFRIKSLRGCIHDVAEVRAFLEAQPDFDPDILCLTSDSADLPTRDRIIQAFEQHLGKARQEDVVVFYFAGHGAREETDIPTFARAGVGEKMEVLICYDSTHSQTGASRHVCLADKEIRYLIGNLSQTGAHILTIFDACHSGTVNRSQGIPRIGHTQALPSRSWEGFCFHDQYAQTDFDDKSLSELIPVGRHVHFAACRDTQVAWEHIDQEGNACGLFTYNLLRILNAASPAIPYQTLQSRLAHLMRSWTHKWQTPQAVALPAGTTLFQPLLGRNYAPLSRSELRFNSGEESAWTLNLGAIHGLSHLQEGLEVRIREEGKNTVIAKGNIRLVGIDASLVEPGSGAELNPDTIYPAELDIWVSHPVRVLIEGAAKEIDRRLDEALVGEGKAYLEWAEAVEEADYRLRVEEDSFRITFPQQESPLVRSIGTLNEQGIRQAFQYLRHIAQWELIRQLSPAPDASSDDRNLALEEVEMQIIQEFPGGKREVHSRSQGEITLALTHTTDQGEPYGLIFLKLINHSQQDVFVCPLYFSMTFGIDVSLIPGGAWLAPGESVWVYEGDAIEIFLEPYILHEPYGWKGSIEYFKLIVSPTQFDPTDLQLEDLPPPEIPGLFRDGVFVFSPKTSQWQGLARWAEQTVRVYIPNM